MNKIDYDDTVNRLWAAYDAIKAQENKDASDEWLANGIFTALSIVKAEMEPVHCGEDGVWLRKGNANKYACSACGYSFETKDKENLFVLRNRFCRHCGARMRRVDHV